jgi:hypothetical protein
MKSRPMDIYYILGDGDKIRDKVEFYLFDQQFDNLKNFSKKLSTAIEKMSSVANEIMDAEIIVAGGDDVLFVIKKDRYKKEILFQLAEDFKLYTGSSLSFGVGTTIEQAYLNLRKAKSMGGGLIIE